MIERHWHGIAAYCKPENKVSLGFGGAHRGEGDFLRAGQLGHTHMIPPI